MWTPSLPCIFWSTIVIQMISVVRSSPCSCPPRPRPESLPAGFLRAHDGDGARHRVGGELRERFVDDVWGDFIGYDGLRDV